MHISHASYSRSLACLALSLSSVLSACSKPAPPPLPKLPAPTGDHGAVLTRNPGDYLVHVAHRSNLPGSGPGNTGSHISNYFHLAGMPGQPIEIDSYSAKGGCKGRFTVSPEGAANVSLSIDVSCNGKALPKTGSGPLGQAIAPSWQGPAAPADQVTETHRIELTVSRAGMASYR